MFNNVSMSSSQDLLGMGLPANTNRPSTQILKMVVLGATKSKCSWKRCFVPGLSWELKHGGKWDPPPDSSQKP